MPQNEKHLYSETAAVQDVYTRKIEHLSPSVKLVFKVLEYKGLMTQKELAAESYLPSRTVRYALSRLKKEGMIEERLYYKDARQCLYGVKSSIHDEIISDFACGIV
ncbi:MAG: MarR family transcriptional regulator [Candidatus Methanoperedens sp.]|nr:MarR family transcriptional regulator [Candidatus Methanoperedens sp.]